MVTIEQVELLEAKVSKAIDYVKCLTAENEKLRDASSGLAAENEMLRGKLDGYQRRIADLEVILQGFKKDQERIEQGIISALEQLNLFEDEVDYVRTGNAAAEQVSQDISTRAETPPPLSGEDEPAPDAESPPRTETPVYAQTVPHTETPYPLETEGLMASSARFIDTAAVVDTLADSDGAETGSGGEEDEAYTEEDDGFLDALRDNPATPLGEFAASEENALVPEERTVKSGAEAELDIF
jgi:FtsZ-binding cell division protein ZapB